jgi:hypothetical protein
MALKAAFRGLAGLALLLLAASAMAQGGDLVRAEWGVPGNRVDVTDRVRVFVHDGVLRLEVTRFALGIDPAPHQNKDLVIRVRRWNGEVEEFKYPERSTVALELDPEDRWERHGDHDGDGDFDRRDRSLRILRAYYGADGQFVNVTDAVRSYVDGGRLSVHVDNAAMGGDPLPGQRKRLRILYVFNGERRNVVVEEKTDLRLP